MLNFTNNVNTIHIIIVVFTVFILTAMKISTLTPRALQRKWETNITSTMDVTEIREGIAH
jgi:hypothetical protein